MRYIAFALVQSTIVWLVYRFAFHAGFHRGLQAMSDIVMEEIARASHVR